MSKLYLENGYLNIEYIMNRARREHTPFIFIVGGRGTGKTYGMLKYVYSSNLKFIYMRHTQKQLDIIQRPELQPFGQLNNDMGWNIRTFPVTSGLSGFYNSITNDEEKWIADGEPVGMLAALSTFSNLRGFDAHDYKILIYDEFIPETHERKLKDEPAALFNAYETINRNRELSGDEPLYTICLSNANDLTNDYFVQLELVGKAVRMQQSGAEIVTLPERGIALYILSHSPISAEKSHTALYKLTGGTEFYNMSINNNFILGHGGIVRSEPLKEYDTIVSFGELCFYRHKSGTGFYCNTHISGAPAKYGASKEDFKRMQNKYFYLWESYLRDRIIFEDYLSENLFLKYWNI